MKKKTKKSKKPKKIKIVKLTPRLREVVRLTSLGCTLDDTAAILGISPSTVDNHRTRAMKLLKVDRAAILTRTAIKQRISPLNDELTPSEKRKKNRARNSR